MNVEQLEIPGARFIHGTRFGDDRGWFQEWFKRSSLNSEIDFDFHPVQANISKSSAGTVRGIHYSTAPEGQAKLVTVMHGEIDDYIIDINSESSTFGKWVRVRLSSETGNAVLLSPHMGHAFQALKDDTVVSYLVTAEYNPQAEKGITPFCPTIAIEWEQSLKPLVSPKDMEAPDLPTQLKSGNLPYI